MIGKKGDTNLVIVGIVAIVAIVGLLLIFATGKRASLVGAVTTTSQNPCIIVVNEDNPSEQCILPFDCGGNVRNSFVNVVISVPDEAFYCVCFPFSCSNAFLPGEPVFPPPHP